MTTKKLSRYEQAWADHHYLWTVYGPAEDMTGGYVDQEDLAQLLRNPTKAVAATALESQIRYWFQIGPDSSGEGSRPDPEDDRLQEIAERYGEEIPS